MINKPSQTDETRRWALFLRAYALRTRGTAVGLNLDTSRIMGDPDRAETMIVAAETEAAEREHQAMIDAQQTPDVAAAIRDADTELIVLRRRQRDVLLRRAVLLRRLVGSEHGGITRAAKVLGVSGTQVSRFLAEDVLRRLTDVMTGLSLAGDRDYVAMTGRKSGAWLTLNRHDDGSGELLPQVVVADRAGRITGALAAANLRVEMLGDQATAGSATDLIARGMEVLVVDGSGVSDPT